MNHEYLVLSTHELVYGHSWPTQDMYVSLRIDLGEDRISHLNRAVLSTRIMLVSVLLSSCY